MKIFEPLGKNYDLEIQLEYGKNLRGKIQREQVRESYRGKWRNKKRKIRVTRTRRYTAVKCGVQECDFFVCVCV